MKICFIVHPNNKDTILDRIAHEIGKGFEESIYHYGVTDVPLAEHYFVTHYSMLPQVIMQVNPGITPVTVFYTHNKGGLLNYLEAFNLCHSVIAESPEGMKELAALGVRQDILHFVPEGGDNEAFQPHARKNDGAILICGTNYADGRKNPEMIKRVLGLLQRDAIFIGKDWWNVTSPVEYKDYPEVFSKCSVYLSCSKLEGGGPNSLIEAMHSNLVPVVSDTGNAQQYIVDGYNGFIFPHDATPEYVAELIEKAYKLNLQDSLPYADIFGTVKDCTWKNYTLNMREIITNDYSLTASQNLDEMDYTATDNE
jgi:glycosyltransferase involved in cell wall biosynthesis